MSVLDMSGDPTKLLQNRFGMFIHWGLYALGARHEWLKNREQITDEDYQKYFDHFDPDLFDPREWARLAKQAGMKYFVITAKHHEGFCLWDSKYTDYKVTNTPCGRDLLHEVVDAFRTEGLGIGFYYSIIDWHHPEFPVDKHHPQRNDKEFREKTKDRDVSKYAEYMRNQVGELLTQFGEIDVIWFDFSYPGEGGKGHEDWESEKLLEVVRKHQPKIMVNNRLDLPGSGDFQTPEQVQPDKPLTDDDGKPIVWEACQTFSGSWGYHREESTWKSVPQLLWMLIDGVSKGGNLLLNVGPTARGDFDYRAKDALEGMGRWMKYNSRSIYGCTAPPQDIVCPPDCRYTFNKEKNRLYLHILNWPLRVISLPGLAEKIEYCQFLHDGSEVRMRTIRAGSDDQELRVVIPIVKPPVDIPVIEIFLK